MDGVFIFLISSRSALEIFRDTGLGPLPLNILAIVGLVILAMAAADAFRKSLPLHPLVLGWAVFLAVLLPSVVIAAVSFGRPGLAGIREWVRLLTYPSVFLLAYAVTLRRGGRRIVDFLFLSLPIPLGLALYQKISGTGLHFTGTHRVHGTLSHPNSLGFYLTIFVGLTFWKYRRTGHILWLGLLIIESFILVWTANVAAFLMVILLCGWMFLKENRTGRILSVALAFFLAAAVAADKQAMDKAKSLESAAPALVAKVAGILFGEAFPTAKKAGASRSVLEDKEDSAVILVHDSMTWRYGNWQNLLRLWRTKPFLGFGLQTTEFINPWKAPEDGLGYSPHNDFLRYLVEAGALGLFVYLFYVVWTGVWILIAYHRSQDPDMRALLWILAGVFLAWQIGSLVDNPIAMTAAQFCFWASLGSAISMNQKKIGVRSVCHSAEVPIDEMPKTRFRTGSFNSVQEDHEEHDDTGSTAADIYPERPADHVPG